MVKVGITGATGFLGSYLRQHLRACGPFEIRALTRTLANQTAESSACDCVTWMQGDLQQPADCADFVRDLDVVVHLAHTNTPLTSNRHLPSDAQANLMSSLN